MQEPTSKNRKCPYCGANAKYPTRIQDDHGTKREYPTTYACGTVTSPNWKALRDKQCILNELKPENKPAKTANTTTYPYYVAEWREGRLKGGPYPEGIQYVPSLKRKWDEGGFGTGSKLFSLRDPNPQELLNQILKKGKHPIHDDIEFYVVRLPNRPKERIHTSQFINIARQMD